MSALLCQYGATTADAAHVQRLQRALQQSRSENQALLTKLQRMERQQVCCMGGCVVRGGGGGGVSILSTTV